MPSPTVFLDERYMLRPEYETRNYDLATDSRTMDFPASGIKIAGTAMDATAAELNYLDLTTLGTGAASKAVVLDSGDDYTWPATGILTVSLVTANANPFVLTGLAGSSSAGGAVNITGGLADGAGNAGGAFTFTTGAGGTTTTATGGAGGAVAVAGGVGGAASGDGTGGAGAAVTITAGSGGAADANSGSEIGGVGGGVTITAGTGGSADSKTGGEGGSVIVTPGAAGETTEIEGGLYLRGATTMPVFFKTTVAPASVSADATLSVGDVFGGVILIDDGGGAKSVQTLPTGTLMTAAAPPDLAGGDSFLLFVVNVETDAGGIAEIAAGADFTVIGSGEIEELDTSTNPSSATFLVRYVSSNTWTCMRVG